MSYHQNNFKKKFYFEKELLNFFCFLFLEQAWVVAEQ